MCVCPIVELLLQTFLQAEQTEYLGFLQLSNHLTPKRFADSKGNPVCVFVETTIQLRRK
jgi:hypothetical protein